MTVTDHNPWAFGCKKHVDGQPWSESCPNCESGDGKARIVQLSDGRIGVTSGILEAPIRLREGEQLVGLVDLDEPALGLATTRQLLEELKARGETEPRFNKLGLDLADVVGSYLARLPGSMLDYRTVDS